MRKWTWLNILIITILGVLLIGTIGVAVFFVLQTTNNSHNNSGSTNDNIIESKNKSGMRYISERTFSLRFVGPSGQDKYSQVGYGTSWLIGKDTSDQTNNMKYYLATNLHVAAFIQNNFKTYYERKENQYVENRGYFDQVHFGSLLTYDENNKPLYVGTESGQLKTESTIFHTGLLIKRNQINPSISVAYTPIELQTKNKYTSLAKTFDEETINNATSDFAILKVDFSKSVKLSTQPWLKNINILDMVLKNFDANPTKFKNPKMNNPEEKITIAGFPYNTETKGPQWRSFENEKPTNVYCGSMFSPKGWKNDYQVYNNSFSGSNKSMQDFKQNYSVGSLIQFKTNDYFSYQNVSLQYLFNSTSHLSGGSSGSMAINENNEVVGIYWGEYSSSMSSHGAIDVLINKNYMHTTGGNLLTPYNIIKDVEAKLNIKLIEEK